MQLEGHIKDDIGVAEARLNIKVGKGTDKDDKAPLQEGTVRCPRRSTARATRFKLPNGGNPATVDYKDFVDLAKLQVGRTRTWCWNTG